MINYQELYNIINTNVTEDIEMNKLIDKINNYEINYKKLLNIIKILIYYFNKYYVLNIF